MSFTTAQYLLYGVQVPLRFYFQVREQWNEQGKDSDALYGWNINLNNGFGWIPEYRNTQAYVGKVLLRGEDFGNDDLLSGVKITLLEDREEQEIAVYVVRQLSSAFASCNLGYWIVTAKERNV